MFLPTHAIQGVNEQHNNTGEQNSHVFQHRTFSVKDKQQKMAISAVTTHTYFCHACFQMCKIQEGILIEPKGAGRMIVLPEAA